MSPKHQMSPKYLAGQKVDTARFGFPEVTGGWGSLQCSALDQRVCELTVSSFFILKNGQIPSTASFDWYQYQGFWKGFHSLQRIELYKDDDDGRTEEREKRKTARVMGSGGPRWWRWEWRSLRPERGADKEGDENEGSWTSSETRISGEWVAWMRILWGRMRGDNACRDLLINDLQLPPGWLALFEKCRKLENKSRPLLLNCPTARSSGLINYQIWKCTFQKNAKVCCFYENSDF